MIRAWWEQRLPRERWLLGLAAAVVAAALAYQLGWAPYQAYRSELAARSEAYDAAHERLVRLEDEIRARQAALPEGGAAGGADGAAAASLLARVDRSLNESGLRPALNGLAETRQGRVAIRFAGAGFTDMLVWLEAVTASGAVAVHSAELSPAETPGAVTGRLVLAAAETAS